MLARILSDELDRWQTEGIHYWDQEIGAENVEGKIIKNPLFTSQHLESSDGLGHRQEQEGEAGGDDEGRQLAAGVGGVHWGPQLQGAAAGLGQAQPGVPGVAGGPGEEADDSDGDDDNDDGDDDNNDDDHIPGEEAGACPPGLRGLRLRHAGVAAASGNRCTLTIGWFDHHEVFKLLSSV